MKSLSHWKIILMDLSVQEKILIEMMTVIPMEKGGDARE
jgi:hypothetical protein